MSNAASTGGFHILTRPGQCGGKPHIAGHRIKVQYVAVWHDREDKRPGEIVAEHPGLRLADVYAALVYYHDHRHEIDADIQSDADFVADLRPQGPPSRLMQPMLSAHGPSDTRSRIGPLW